MGINNIITAFIVRLKKPRISRNILLAAEILIIIAACLTLVAILKLHPIPLTLFLMIAQPFFIIGIALYLVVTIAGFISHHGTSQISFESGEIIFRKGDEGEFMYTIISGEVEIIKEDIDGGEKVIARLEPGDYFGEMALMSDSPRNATVKAVNSVETMTIARGDLRKLHDYLPALKDNIDKIIQSRMPVSKTKDIGMTADNSQK